MTMALSGSKTMDEQKRFPFPICQILATQWTEHFIKEMCALNENQWQIQEVLGWVRVGELYAHLIIFHAS